MYIEITILDEENPLKGEFFRFTAFETVLVLEEYLQFERPTKRHKPVIGKVYSRLDTRKSTMRENEVVIPDDVRQQASEKFISMIKICKWSEYKKQ